MKCSLCKEDGHRRNNRKFHPIDQIVVAENTIVTTPTLQTENTGKMFEMAICLAYNIPYDGTYKYGMELPEKLKPRLSKLVELIPNLRHTARKGSPYDYTSTTDETLHLSAKSTKKGVGKVAPQVVGQSQPSDFCTKIGIEFTNLQSLKEYIQTNVKTILPILVKHTFNTPIVYFNEKANTIRYITMTSPIDWDTSAFRWTCDFVKWNNSSLLKIAHEGREYGLVEFQIHSKSRSNMAIRWCFENVLSVFKANLSIIDL